MGIPCEDRVAWRQETQNGITAFEVKRLQDLDAKRSSRKERRAQPAHLRALPAQCEVAPVPASSGCVRTLDIRLYIFFLLNTVMQAMLSHCHLQE